MTEASFTVLVGPAGMGKIRLPGWCRRKEGRHKSTALFNNKGEVTGIEQTLQDGGVEEMTIVVNRKTNTITYAIHETGEFAREPLGYTRISASSGGGEASSDPAKAAVAWTKSAVNGTTPAATTDRTRSLTSGITVEGPILTGRTAEPATTPYH